jgi:hypothetical protein
LVILGTNNWNLIKATVGRMHSAVESATPGIFQAY